MSKLFWIDQSCLEWLSSLSDQEVAYLSNFTFSVCMFFILCAMFAWLVIPFLFDLFKFSKRKLNNKKQVPAVPDPKKTAEN